MVSGERFTRTASASVITANRGSASLPPAQALPARAARVDDDVRSTVPRVLGVTAALGWRLLVVVAALYVIGTVASYLAAVVVPVAVALLLAALLSPAVHRLQTLGVPRGVATALVMVGGLAGHDPCPIQSRGLQLQVGTPLSAAAAVARPSRTLGGTKH